MKEKDYKFKNGVWTAKSKAFKVLSKNDDGNPTAYLASSSGFVLNGDHCFILAPNHAALARVLSSGKVPTPKWSAKNFQRLEIRKARP